MNNLEKLLEASKTDKAALTNLVRVMGRHAGCISCPAGKFCKKESYDGMEECADIRATWLLQKYVEPDSWERIEADAKKPCNIYFNCVGYLCEECPSKFSDGRNPSDHYGVDSCNKAVRLDLIARCKQLALDGVL